MTKKKDEAPAEEPAKIDEKPGPEATLAERILWVRDRVTRLGKDATVGAGGSSYAAISHDKVTASIRPKMVQAGIMHYMTLVEANDADTGAVTGKGRKIVQHRAIFDVVFYCANTQPHDLRGESLSTVAPSNTIVIRQAAYADDYGDKAPGKAASYAMKYALLKLFMVETGEEDEARILDAEQGGRAPTLLDDENKQNEVYALADELFGADADKMLTALAKRRFFVDTYQEIPLERFNDAIWSLRKKYESEQEKG